MSKSMRDTIDHIESVTKVTKHSGRIIRKFEMTPEDYREEWCEFLYDRYVVGKKCRLTHRECVYRDYLSAANVGDGCTWHYEIHWKG
jgi:hypothetical protein